MPENNAKPNITVIIGGVEFEPASTEDLNSLMELWQEAMVEDQIAIAGKFGISHYCATLIQYLRSRSRWTQEKENELIRRDKAGERLPVVTNGDF